MRVQLLQDIPKLGKKGDVVEVSGGYAKNALIPKKRAVYATEQTIHAWHAQKERKEREDAQESSMIQALLPKLREHTFTFTLKGRAKGVLFESLHHKDIQKAIAEFCTEQHSALTPELIHVHTKPIKQIGDIKIPVKIGRGSHAQELELSMKIQPQP